MVRYFFDVVHPCSFGRLAVFCLHSKLLHNNDLALRWFPSLRTNFLFFKKLNSVQLGDVTRCTTTMAFLRWRWNCIYTAHFLSRFCKTKQFSASLRKKGEVVASYPIRQGEKLRWNLTSAWLFLLIEWKNNTKCKIQNRTFFISFWRNPL